MPHAAPVRNREKRVRRVAFTPPPLETKKKRGQRVAFTRPRLNKNSPPTTGGGMIKLERGGVRLLRRLVGFWNKKRGRREHERPPPSPPISPASSFPPSLASLLPVLSSLLLAPQSLISVPTSLEKGRGSHGDAAKAFGIGDVAFGACRRR
jgi:hypothetical protein